MILYTINFIDIKIMIVFIEWTHYTLTTTLESGISSSNIIWKILFSCKFIE